MAPILDIKGDYFLELVWQFFANIKEKETIGLPILRTFVNVVSLELKTDFLANLLQVPNYGPFINYNQYDTVFSDLDFGFFAATQRITYRRTQTGTCYNIFPTSIPLIDRLICYFISTIPRKTGNNEQRNMDIYIIDKMLNGLGKVSALLVASIILSHMCYVGHLISLKNTKHHTLFAINISRILAS